MISLLTAELRHTDSDHGNHPRGQESQSQPNCEYIKKSIKYLTKPYCDKGYGAKHHQEAVEEGPREERWTICEVPG